MDSISIFVFNKKYFPLPNSLFNTSVWEYRFLDSPSLSYSSKILVKKNSFVKRKNKARKHYCKRYVFLKEMMGGGHSGPIWVYFFFVGALKLWVLVLSLCVDNRRMHKEHFCQNWLWQAKLLRLPIGCQHVNNHPQLNSHLLHWDYF